MHKTGNIKQKVSYMHNKGQDRPAQLQSVQGLPYEVKEQLSTAYYISP